MYNATAPVFRRVVFGNDREETKALAVEGTRSVMKYAEQYLGGLRLRLRVLARDLHGHRARLRRRGLRGGHGRLAARARPGDHPEPALHRRAVHPQRVRRPDRVDDPEPAAPRARVPVRAHPQRPGHRRRRRRAGRAGRRGPDRGLPVRQRRADRQRLPGHPGPEPVQPGHRPDDRFLRHRRDPAHRRVLQPASGAPPAPVRGRPGLHGVLRLAPGRHQEGPGGAWSGTPRPPGTPVRDFALGGAVPAHRPAGRGPHATRP